MKRLIQKLRVIRNEAIDAPFGGRAQLFFGIDRPSHDLATGPVDFLNDLRLQQVVARKNDRYRKITRHCERGSAVADESQWQSIVQAVQSQQNFGKERREDEPALGRISPQCCDYGFLTAGNFYLDV